MNNKIALKLVIGSFSLAWLSWGGIIIANQFGYFKYGTPLFMALYALGGLAPAIVAITLLLKNKIMPAKQLFKTIFAVKQPIRMYLYTIGFLVLYFGLGTFLGLFEYVSPIYLSLLTFPIMIIGGGFEEVGWRFVFQPALEKKLPFAAASAITGVIWSLWHLPLFYIEGTSQYAWSFVIFAIGTVGGAFMLAAIYRLSKSVWLCVLFHTLINCLYESFRINADNFDIAFVPVIITSAVLIIVATILVMLAKKHPTHCNQE